MNKLFAAALLSSAVAFSAQAQDVTGTIHASQGTQKINREIYEQTDLLLRVSLVHDGFVLLDHVFNAEAFAHGPVVVIVAELGSRTLAAVPSGYCIIM